MLESFREKMKETKALSKDAAMLLKRLREYSPETYIHSVSVAELLKNFAESCGLLEGEGDKLYEAGLLHDIGKLTIPKQILHKQGSLLREERKRMEEHSLAGYELLLPYVDRFILLAVRQHHERCDGSGYPDRLEGEQITKQAKLLMLADVYDGMTCRRSYRKQPISEADALSIICSEARLYETEYLQKFLNYIQKNKIPNYSLAQKTRGMGK